MTENVQRDTFISIFLPYSYLYNLSVTLRKVKCSGIYLGISIENSQACKKEGVTRNIASVVGH